MARRSILSGVRDEQPAAQISEMQTEPSPVASSVKPSRRAKLHLGGYYDPNDPTIIAFQKLGIDLRKSQQEMLLDAVKDLVAKQEAFRAFR